MELDYCVPLGIPHSKFLEWEEDDQDKAVAWTIENRSLCKRCGTKPHEWLDEEGKEVVPPPYEATDRRCLGCATLERHREEIPKEMKTSIDAYLVPGSEAEPWKSQSS